MLSKIINEEIEKNRLNKPRLSFYQYSLVYNGLFNTGKRYCEKCRKLKEKYFDDFCEYCGGYCLQCCLNTKECQKYR